MVAYARNESRGGTYLSMTTAGVWLAMMTGVLTSMGEKEKARPGANGQGQNEVSSEDVWRFSNSTANLSVSRWLPKGVVVTESSATASPR